MEMPGRRFAVCEQPAVMEEVLARGLRAGGRTVYAGAVRGGVSARHGGAYRSWLDSPQTGRSDSEKSLVCTKRKLSGIQPVS